jgi:hypothetical protein
MELIISGRCGLWGCVRGYNSGVLAQAGVAKLSA